MSDRVAVMADGHFEQISDPYSLYREPQSLFAAQFVGLAASLPIAPCDEKGLRYAGRELVGRSAGGNEIRPGHGAVAVVRPEALRLDAPAGIAFNSIPAVVQDSTFRGSWTELRVLTCEGHELSVHQPVGPAGLGPRSGDKVEVYFAHEDTKIFWGASGAPR